MRDPAYFVGSISKHVNFCEAISTLHHFVVSDLRFKLKDWTAYFAWLETQKGQMLAEAAAAGQAANERLDVLRKELNDISRRQGNFLRPFFRAQQL